MSESTVDRSAETVYRNVGHGHVFPRPDRHKARCGGPAICAVCAKDAAKMAGEPRPDPFRPSVALLCKLGSLVVHLEEATSPGGHEFDITACKQLREDPEVDAWFRQMQTLAMVPVKR